MNLDHSKINIHINGDKSCFFSKSGLNKFKLLLKTNPNKYNELYSFYMKPEYKLELVENIDNDIKFNIIKKEIIVKNNNKEILINKIKSLKKNRTQLKNNSSLDNNIEKEYYELKKNSKIPILDPNDVLSDPDQYKDIISLIINGELVKKLGTTHPYIKYYRSLYNKIINIQNTTNIPNLIDNINTTNTPNLIDNINTTNTLNLIDTNNQQNKDPSFYKEIIDNINLLYNSDKLNINESNLESLSTESENDNIELEKENNIELEKENNIELEVIENNIELEKEKDNIELEKEVIKSEDDINNINNLFIRNCSYNLVSIPSETEFEIINDNFDINLLNKKLEGLE